MKPTTNDSDESLLLLGEVTAAQAKDFALWSERPGTHAAVGHRGVRLPGPPRRGRGAGRILGRQTGTSVSESPCAAFIPPSIPTVALRPRTGRIQGSETTHTQTIGS